MVVFCIAVLCAFSVAYAFYNGRLNASTPSYHAGGNVTGRINKAPSNLNVKNLEFQKGDRVLLGTMNPETNNSIALQLVEETTYRSYNCPTYTANCSQTTPITSWSANTTEAIAHPNTGIEKSDFITVAGSYSYAPYTVSNLYQVMNDFNASLISADRKVLTYRNAEDELSNIASISHVTQKAMFENAFSTSYNTKDFYDEVQK